MATANLCDCATSTASPAAKPTDPTADDLAAVHCNPTDPEDDLPAVHSNRSQYKLPPKNRAHVTFQLPDTRDDEFCPTPNTTDKVNSHNNHKRGYSQPVQEIGSPISPGMVSPDTGILRHRWVCCEVGCRETVRKVVALCLVILTYSWVTYQMRVIINPQRSGHENIGIVVGRGVSIVLCEAFIIFVMARFFILQGGAHVINILQILTSITVRVFALVLVSEQLKPWHMCVVVSELWLINCLHYHESLLHVAQLLHDVPKLWQIGTVAVEAVESLSGLKTDFLALLINGGLLSLWILNAGTNVSSYRLLVAYAIIVGGSIFCLLSLCCISSLKSRAMIKHAKKLTISISVPSQPRQSSTNSISALPSVQCNGQRTEMEISVTSDYADTNHCDQTDDKVDMKAAPLPASRSNEPIARVVQSILGGLARLISVALAALVINAWALFILVCLWIVYLTLHYSCRTYAPHCTERPNTPHCTERPNTPHCTERPNTPYCTERPNTPYCTERPNTPYCTERPHTSHCTERPHTNHWTETPDTNHCTDTFSRTKILSYSFKAFLSTAGLQPDILGIAINLGYLTIWAAVKVLDRTVLTVVVYGVILLASSLEPLGKLMPSCRLVRVCKACQDLVC